MIPPHIKFYPQDWQDDPKLRACSLEARGLWIELISIMHFAKRRGYLESPDGTAISLKKVSEIIGIDTDSLVRIKAELLRNGVPSVSGSGVWMCRRMVREAAKAEKCRAAGKNGGGNPMLKQKSEECIVQPVATVRAQFSGDVCDEHACMVNDVLNCRPEFKRLPVAGILTAIHRAKENPRMKENHQKFLADMANSLTVPRVPANTYGTYLQDSGASKKSSQRTAGVAACTL